MTGVGGARVTVGAVAAREAARRAGRGLIRARRARRALRVRLDGAGLHRVVARLADRASEALPLEEPRALGAVVALLRARPGAARARRGAFREERLHRRDAVERLEGIAFGLELRDEELHDGEGLLRVVEANDAVAAGVNALEIGGRAVGIAQLEAVGLDVPVDRANIRVQRRLLERVEDGVEIARVAGRWRLARPVAERSAEEPPVPGHEWRDELVGDGELEGDVLERHLIHEVAVRGGAVSEEVPLVDHRLERRLLLDVPTVDEEGGADLVLVQVLREVDRRLGRALIEREDERLGRQIGARQPLRLGDERPGDAPDGDGGEEETDRGCPTEGARPHLSSPRRMRASA